MALPSLREQTQGTNTGNKNRNKNRNESELNPLPRQSGVAKFAPVADAFEHPQREAARRALEHDGRGKRPGGTEVRTNSQAAAGSTAKLGRMLRSNES